MPVTIGQFFTRYAIWALAIILMLFIRVLYVLCIPVYMGITGFGVSRLNKSDPLNKYSRSFWPLWRITWPRPPRWRDVSKPQVFVRKRRITENNTGVVAGERGHRRTANKTSVVQEVLPPLESDSP